MEYMGEKFEVKLIGPEVEWILATKASLPWTGYQFYLCVFTLLNNK